MESQLYRPRSTTEILDAAFQLFKRHYLPLLVLCVVAYGPVLLATAWMQSVMGPATEVEDIDFGWAPFFVVATLWFLVAEVAMLVGASDGYTADGVAPASALGRTLRRVFPLIGAILLKWIILIFPPAVAGGLAAALIALTGGPLAILLAFVAVIGSIGLFLFLFGRFVAVPAVTVLEGLGPIASLTRSFALTEGRWLGAVAVIALAYIVIYAIAMVILVVGMIVTAAVAADPMLGTSLGNFAVLFFYPFLSVATIVLYYDLRIRREGYDVELMARSLETPPSPAEPHGVA